MYSVSDLTEAQIFSHQTDYIHIYSNSWGPADFGFIVAGPRRLARLALETAVKKVRYPCK